MKVSELSVLWDYINRAMPWNQPKSLTTDDVYAVVAYILNMGGVVPSDYVLSGQEHAGHAEPPAQPQWQDARARLWERGKPDVQGVRAA